MRLHALATRSYLFEQKKKDFDVVLAAAATASASASVVAIVVVAFVSRASDFNVCFHNLLIFIV